MFEMKAYPNRNYVYDPFRDIADLERRFFSKPLNVNGGERPFRTDLRDTGDAFLLEADLPGCEKSDIHLELKDDVLTVRAERHSAHEEEDEKNNYLRCERSYGSYRRRFDVSAVDCEHIAAKYENGVLTVTLPKKAITEPAVRTLEIQ